MIGLTIVIGKQVDQVKKLDSAKESWHFCKSLVDSEGIKASYVGYNGYPFDSWQYKDFLIVVEGIIYNYEDGELRSSLNNIADNDFSNVDITSFINKSDGDYCIYIINVAKKSVIAFNDILGGLPLFYACEDDTLYISRQFGLIASNLNDRKWNCENIAEYLKFNYNLRNRTFSAAINKFEPASIVRACYSDKIEFKYENLYVDDFLITDQYKSKGEAAKDLANIFLESCRRRVDYAKSHGYTIVNTLSGGFDSRTILGGLEKYTDDYINITYEYYQDESAIAKQLLKALDSKSKYVKLNFKNSPDFYDARLTYNTDGRINVYTNSICYHDMLSVRQHFSDEKVLYFGGFGGEYIRHPKYETIMPFNKAELFDFPTYSLLSNLCNSSEDKLQALFTSSFSSSSKQRESKYKDLYNEYYQNLVRCSGEDRTRMFYFTVQPMMGKDFIMAIRHRVPLKWVGYVFYKNFLKAIDERLLSVDIFNHNSNFLKDWNLGLLDFVRRNGADFMGPCKIIRGRLRTDETIEYSSVKSYMEGICKLGLFNESYISKHYSDMNTNLKYSLIAVTSYIYEIEKLAVSK